MNEPESKVYEIMTVLVNYGVGSKVLQIVRQYGFKGGTVMIGTGTVSSNILNFFGLDEIRKEIFMMIAPKTLIDSCFESLGAQLKLEKPNRGIAYTTRIEGLIGAGSCKYEAIVDDEREGEPMYKAINVVVDKGVAEEVIEAATKAGARGGTIINARGSGIHESSKLFAMEIEPEKEMVVILAKTEISDAIIEAIRADVRIDEPGRGILFVQDVTRTYGIRK